MHMLVHSTKYTTALADFGIEKPFALDRGQLVMERLKKEVDAGLTAVEPQPITIEQALLVHTPRYIDSLRDPDVWKEIFELSAEQYHPECAVRPLNELFDDIAFKSGGTLLASRLAFKHGLAANLGGGYHHAFPDEGRGFCVLNDIAIAIRCLQNENLARRVLIVDVDFHQGDGSALIFKGDDSVFTLSIHSQEGWPDIKQQSDIDVPIYQDKQHLYLEKLQAAIAEALRRFSPEFVVFVAGSDAYELDVLPGTSFIKLSLSQMKQRDEFVLETFAKLGVPLAMVFAGGYGPRVWEVHYFATKKLVELAIR